MKKNPIFLLFSILMLFLYSCSSSLDHVNPYDIKTPPRKQAPATLYGEVVLEDESDCSGVNITLTGDFYSASTATYRETTGTTSCRFTISGIYPGSYKMVVSTRYYRPYVKEIVLPIGGIVDAGTIELKLLRVKVNGSVKLLSEDGGFESPSGTVITLRKVGSIKMNTSAHSYTFFPQAESVSVSYTAVASEDGTFTVTDVPAGVYDIVAEKEGYAPGVIAGYRIGKNEEAEDNVGTISLRKVTGDFEIVGYLSPLNVIPPVESNRYTATTEVTLNLYGFNAVQMIVVNGTKDKCDFSKGSWEDFTASKKWFLSPGDGLKYVCVRFRDLSGRESKILRSSITLDTEKPVIYRFEPLSSEYLNFYDGVYYWRGGDTLPFQFSIYDETSGVKGFYIEEDGKPLWNKENIGNWVSFRNYYSVTITSEGEHKFKGCFSDFSHNVTCTSVPLIVVKDTHVPSLQLDIYSPSITSSPDVEYHLTADDGINNVSSLLFEVSDRDDFAGATWQPFTSTGVFHFSSDGDVTLYARVKDRAGNISSTVSRDITIDTTPPQNIVFRPVSIYVNSDTPLFYISADGATYYRICESSSFQGSNCRWREYNPGEVLATLTPEEGWHNVYAQFKDEAGNLSGIVSTQVFYDDVPPSAAGISIVEKNEYGYVNNENVTVNIFASGAYYMKITGDVVGENIWRSYRSSYSIILKGDDGYKKVCVKFRDLAGNLSETICDRVYIDRLPPLVDEPYFEISGGRITNSREIILQLFLDPSEEYDEVQFEISQDGTFYDATWRDYQEFVTWNVTGDDGVKTLFLRFRDLAGNVTPLNSYYSLEFTLDTTPPRINVFKTEQYYTNSRNIALKLIAGDNISGNLYVSYSEDVTSLGSNWLPYEENVTFEISDYEGMHTIYSEVRDEAGNVSQITKTDVVYDKTPPEDGYILIDNGAISFNKPDGTVKISISSYDDLSGLDRMEISENSDFSDSKILKFSPEVTYTISSPGLNQERLITIYARFSDRAGNWSSPVSDTIFYDTRAPVASNFKINNGAFWTFDRDVTLSFNVSGAQYYEVSEKPNFSDAEWEPLVSNPVYRIKSSSEGSVTLYLRFKDRADNISVTLSDSICLDLTPPASPVVEIVNSRNGYTGSNILKLKAYADFSPACVTSESPYVRFSTSPDFSNGTGWIRYDEHLTYQLGITNESDGRIMIFAQFADQAGETSEVANNSVIKDTLPPANSGVIVVSGKLFNGIEYVNTQDVVLKLSAYDPSPITFVASNSPFFEGKPQSFVEYYTHILSPGDGNKEVYVRFYDAAGNYSDAVTGNIILDTTPPSIPAVIYQNQITNQVDYVLKRSGGSVDSNFLLWECQGGDRADFVPCGGSESTTDFYYRLLTGTPQRINMLRLRAVDKAGNTGDSAIVQIIYDSTPPTRPLLGHRGSRIFVNTDSYLVEITTPSSDVNFDLYQYCVEDGDTSYCPDSDFVNSSQSLEIPVPLEPDKVVSVFIRGKDKAGNVSQYDRVVIEQDSDPPSAPQLLLNEVYVNAISIPVFLSRGSVDPSLADPGEDNFDHYEVYGGLNCKTGDVYNNDSIGRNEGLWVCLFREGGIPLLKNGEVDVEIYAVDKAGNRSYPALLRIFARNSEPVFTDSNLSDLITIASHGIFYRKYSDSKVFFYNFDDEKIYSDDIYSRFANCSEGTDYLYVESLKSITNYDGNEILLGSGGGLLPNFLLADKFEMSDNSWSSYSYLFPTEERIATLATNQGGVAWVTTGKGIIMAPSVTSSTFYNVDKWRCYFNYYRVTSETQIYGFYQLVNLSRESTDGLYGMYGNVYGDSAYVSLIPLSCLGTGYGENGFMEKTWVMVPVDARVQFGTVFVAGICTDGNNRLSWKTLSRDDNFPGVVTMPDMELIGSSESYNPAITEDNHEIAHISVDDSRAYSQILLLQKHKVADYINLYYAPESIKDFTQSERSYNTYKTPFTPGEVREILEIPEVINGYERLFFDSDSYTGTDRLRGIEISFNSSYKISAIRAYLKCSGNTTIRGAIYKETSSDTYSRIASTSTVNSFTSDFFEYVLRFDEPVHVDSDAPYLIVFQWRGDSCEYYAGGNNPIERPYGVVERRVMVNNVSEVPLTISSSSIQTGYFYEIGFDISEGGDIIKDPGRILDLSGRYLFLATSFDSSNPLTYSTLRVIDLGENFLYDSSDRQCIIQSGDGIEFGILDATGKSFTYVYTTNDGTIRHVFYDFGSDGIPCTGDDEKITTDISRWVDSERIYPSLSMIASMEPDVVSLRTGIYWYDLAKVKDYGDNWYGNIQPEKKSENGFAGDSYLLGDIPFVLQENYGNENYTIYRENPEIFYPFGSTSVDNGFKISSNGDYVVVTGFDYYNNLIQGSTLYVFDRITGKYIGGIKSEDSFFVSVPAGNEVFINANFTNFTQGQQKYLMYDIHTGNLFEPSNISGGYKLKWGDYEFLISNFNVPSGTRFLFSSYENDRYVVHIYDLGDDGIHVDEGSGDDREDWIDPFPFEMSVTTPVGFYLTDTYFAVEVTEADFVHDVLYGKLGSTQIKSIHDIDVFLGISGEDMYYIADSYLHRRNLSSDDDRIMRVAYIHDFFPYNVGRKGDWIFFASDDNIFGITAINLFSNEEIPIFAGNNLPPFTGSVYPGKFIEPDGNGFMFSLQNGKRILMRYEIGR